MKNLLSFLTKTSASTADQFEDALQTANEDLGQAEQALAEARRTYDNSKINPDASVSMRAREQVIAAEVQVDRAQALVELAEQRLGEARQAEAEDARRKCFAEAERLNSDASAALAEYPALAERLLVLLEISARADLAVAAANQNLPAGRAPLVPAEQLVRGQPEVPEEILRQEVRADWQHAGGSVVEEEHVSLIKTRDGEHGSFQLSRGGVSREYTVTKRRHRVEKLLPQISAVVPTPLAFGLVLPGVREGEPNIWPRPSAENLLDSVKESREIASSPPPVKPPRTATTRVNTIDSNIEADVHSEAAE